MGVEEYKRKRSLKKSGEPSGGRSSRGKPKFVVHLHHARRVHYDFRLEVNGVLKSWAVPKGFSMDPREKRLAVMTEDHPMNYGSFEGVIPEGNYGAGKVIVWDAGTYVNPKGIPMAKMIEDGHLTVTLFGKKLRGGFALTRTGVNWILVKMRDEEAEEGHAWDEASVLTGRTVEEL